MLEGALGALAELRATYGYGFNSTHSGELHQSAVDKLSNFGYRVEVLSDFDSEATYFDGLVFASNPSVKTIFTDFNPLNKLQILGASPFGENSLYF